MRRDATIQLSGSRAPSSACGDMMRTESLNAAPVSRHLLRALGFFALWTLVGLAFAGQFYLSSSLLGRTITWTQAITYSLGDWYVWAILSLPVIRFARRYPPEAGVSWRVGFIHLGAALVFSLAYIVLRSLVGQVHGWLIDEPVTFIEVFRPLLVKTFPFNLLIYGVIVSVSHAIDYYRKYHERTVQALELEKHLTEARLQSLLRQLKPHFLFNSLNGIASLMYSDVAAADKMLVRLVRTPAAVDVTFRRAARTVAGRDRVPREISRDRAHPLSRPAAVSPRGRSRHAGGRGAESRLAAGR